MEPGKLQTRAWLSFHNQRRGAPLEEKWNLLSVEIGLRSKWTSLKFSCLKLFSRLSKSSEVFVRIWNPIISITNTIFELQSTDLWAGKRSYVFKNTRWNNCFPVNDLTTTVLLLSKWLTFNLDFLHYAEFPPSFEEKG